MNLWIAMFENSAKIYLLNYVDQIVLFNGFLSDFVEVTSCVYTKTIILFNLVNSGFRNIYLAASSLVNLDFKE